MIYRIGNLAVDSGCGIVAVAVGSLPGFACFESVISPGEPVLIHLRSGNGDLTVEKVVEWLPLKQPIYHITADDAEISLFRRSEGRFLLKIDCEGDALLMSCGPEMQEVEFAGALTPRMLKYALWVAYGMRALAEGRVAVHASAVVADGRASLFLGESGTGKSTHTRLWTEHVAGATLLNDDSPIVACEGDSVVAYGSPWSGKTHCYRAESFPLASFTRLHQAPENRIERLGIARGFAALHPSMPPFFCYDDFLSGRLAEIESGILSRVPVFGMGSLPDAGAARMSFSVVSGNQCGLNQL